jgi:hypothetical protein
LARLQLAAGGVLVGLTAGMLTRRLLRMLRWHGASTSQVGACSGAPLACQHASAIACCSSQASLKPLLSVLHEMHFLSLSCSWWPPSKPWDTWLSTLPTHR